MVKSFKVFKTSRNVAKVALVITYIGFGQAQFSFASWMMLVPPLGDPMSVIENQLMTQTSSSISQTHDIQEMVCLNNRYPGDNTVILSQVGATTVIQSLMTDPLVSLGGNYLVSSPRIVSNVCKISHYYLSNDRKFVVGCGQPSGPDQSVGRYSVLGVPVITNDSPSISDSQNQIQLVRVVSENPRTVASILNLRSITKIPGPDYSFAVVDENNIAYLCGSETDGSSKVCIRLIMPQLVDEIESMESSNEMCVAIGQDQLSPTFWSYIFNCAYPASFVQSMSVSIDPSQQFSFSSSKKMAFAISQKPNTQTVIFYGKSKLDQVDYIFAQSMEKWNVLSKLFPQEARLFSEPKVKLQSIKDFDSLIFVLNGSKSVTLLNWVQSKEIQTWATASSSQRISGCVARGKIVILDFEIGVSSTISTFNLKSPSSGCISMNGKLCRPDLSDIYACDGGSLLSTSITGVSECKNECVPRQFPFLGEVCVPCHKNCLTCSDFKEKYCSSCANGSEPLEGAGCNGCVLGQIQMVASGQCENCSTNCEICSTANTCDVCQQSFFFNQGSGCMSFPTLPLSGIYVNKNLRQKAPCNSNCATCDGPFSNSCLSCTASKVYTASTKTCGLPICNSHEYYDLNLSQCEQCHETCGTCSGKTQSECLSCPVSRTPKLYLDQGKCSQDCPTQYFKDDPNLSCQKCDLSCQECLKLGSDYCISCHQSKFLMPIIQSPIRGTCEDQCLSSQYSDSSKICRACDASCGECQDLPTKCTICKQGAYLHQNQCLPSCPSGYFEYGLVCSQCPSDCVKCLNQNECKKCNNLTFLQNNLCVSWCQFGVPDNISRICCYSDCATCRGETNTDCLSCSGILGLYNNTCHSNCGLLGLTLSGNLCVSNTCDESCATCSGPGPSDCLTCSSVAPKLYINQCKEACPNGTYESISGGKEVCLNCHEKCGNCQGPEETDCLSCPLQIDANKRTFLQFNRCVLNCSTGSFKDIQTQMCLACNSACRGCLDDTSSSCTSCNVDKVLQIISTNPEQGTCEVSCQNAQYLDINMVCRSCISPCETCVEQESKCTSCKAGLGVLHLNSCVPSCPQRYFNNQQMCQFCGDACLNCSSSTVCLQCDSSTFLHNGKCVNSCPSVNSSNTALRICCHEDCLTCSGLLQNSCESCRPGSFYISATKSCSPCNSECSTCDGGNNNNCLSCPDISLAIDLEKLRLLQMTTLVYPSVQTYIDQQKCVTECPVGKFKFANPPTFTCNLCHATCSKCLNSDLPDKCTDCPNGRVRSGLTVISGVTYFSCLTHCPEGQVAINGECFACSSTCKTCAVDVSTCTSCDVGQYLYKQKCQSNLPLKSYCISMDPLVAQDFTDEVGNVIQQGYFEFCRDCDLSCETCTDSVSCEVCINSYQRISDEHPSLCRSNCPSATYYDDISSECKPCDSNACSNCMISSNLCTDCLSFNPPRYLKDRSCLSDCGDRFFGDDLSRKCLPCSSTCLRCSGSSSNQCLSCIQTSMNKYLLNNECLAQCPDNLILNKQNNNCEPCPSTCSTCNNDGCATCPGGYPAIDGKCKIVCPQGQVWVAPNNCEACDSKCDFCSDVTKACNINLSYQLKLPEMQIGQKISVSTIQVELHIFREGGKGFSLEQVISQALLASSLKLTVKSTQEVLPFTIEVTPLQTIVLNVQKPAQISTGQAYTILGSEPSLLTTYKDLVTKVDTNFLLVQNQSQEVEILNNDLPAESVTSATSTGNTVSSVTGSLGVTTDILGVLGVVMSADQTGATLKFSQISKLISRLRYVDVNFGQVFGGFLNGLGNAFDKKTSFDASTAFNDKKGEELQEIVDHATKRIKLQEKISNGRKGKFNTYLVDFFLIGKTDNA